MVDVGDVLADRYVLAEAIGHGGMARVFRAHDRVLERDVAVKVLSGHRAEQDSFRQRFRREARAAASLSHTNIVTVHDTGAQGEDLYIVMELVNGPGLDRVIQREGALEPDRAARVASAVCRALGAAHEQGLVHRDVKPANILFDDADNVKVTDFGIVRVVEAATTTDTVYGSAPFISPEQARGDGVDARSDLYSLGCVLYTMLTGREPFDSAGEPLSVVYRHIHEHPPAPSSLEPGVPPALDEIVERALRKDPDERYPSAQDMATALDDAVTAAGRHTRRLETPMDGATVPIAGQGAVVAASSEGPDVTDGDLDGSVDAAAAQVAGDGDAGGGPAEDAPGRSDRRRRPLLVLAGLGLAAVAVVLAAMLTGDPGSPSATSTPAGTASSPPPETPTPTPPGTPTPTSPETATPTPEQSRPASPAAATDHLLEVLAIGERSGAVTEKAAEEIRKRAEEALEKFDEGDVEEALKKVAEAREKLAEYRSKDEVDAGAATAISAAIQQVESALLAAPPPDADDDHPGKGKGKDDEDGNDD